MISRLCKTTRARKTVCSSFAVLVGSTDQENTRKSIDVDQFLLSARWSWLFFFFIQAVQSCALVFLCNYKPSGYGRGRETKTPKITGGKRQYGRIRGCGLAVSAEMREMAGGERYSCRE